jgi:hypothetical protein
MIVRPPVEHAQHRPRKPPLIINLPWSAAALRLDAPSCALFPAVRLTSMSHTLAEAATAPSGFAESLIARLATGLDSADREPFRWPPRPRSPPCPLRCWGTARSTAWSSRSGAGISTRGHAARWHGTTERTNGAPSSSPKASDLINPSLTLKADVRVDVDHTCPATKARNSTGEATFQ